jgi:tryptophan-rich sensory protein
MKTAKLAWCLLLPLCVGGVAGFFSAEAIPGWYANLNKPVFNPPNTVFGPVWTTLYLLMGYSSYRIWMLPKVTQRTTALGVYALQLALNFIWSFLFFNMRAMGLALIEIVLLWFSILWMIRLFYRIDRKAALLQIPYLLWVSFATALNAAYWWLNR